MYKIIIALIISIVVDTSVAAQPVCVNVTAENVAKLYMLAGPASDPADFFDMVTRNKGILKQNSPTVLCAKKLGERLVNLGIKAYDPKAYEDAMGAGPTELAADVANSITSGSVNLMQIGSELKWLANILPDAAAGNFEPFNNTGTPERQMIRLTYALVPEAEQTAQQYMKSFLPSVEKQIFMLAMMVGG